MNPEGSAFGRNGLPIDFDNGSRVSLTLFSLERSFIPSHLIDLTLSRGCNTEISQSYLQNRNFSDFFTKSKLFSFHFKIETSQVSFQNQNFSDFSFRSKFLTFHFEIEISYISLQNRNFSGSISKSKFLTFLFKIENFSGAISQSKYSQISVQN